MKLKLLDMLLTDSGKLFHRKIPLIAVEFLNAEVLISGTKDTFMQSRIMIRKRFSKQSVNTCWTMAVKNRVHKC